MDIQNIILRQGRKRETDLLFRVDGEDAIVQFEQEIQINRNHKISFDTYYNIFSVVKWRKYTQIEKVGLRLVFNGKALVEICFSEDGKERVVLEKIYLDTEQRKEEILKIDDYPCKGVLYFSIKSMDNFILYDAAWCSWNFKMNDSINLGIAICTYKKENFVIDNISAINQSLEEGCLRVFKRKVHVYISDNGRTLNKKELENKYISVIPNKNCGGVGGFTRCMIEILKYNNESKNKVSHVVLMDDDVVIDPEVIVRTLMFLQCLKKDYADYSLCGAMLYQENACIQHSSGEVWRNGEGFRLKANYNLARFEEVWRNEKEEKIDYAGWFYSVIPVTEIKRCGLPLPIFVHCDDIEYGLRMHGKFITLNGINIWHPDHSMKRVTYIKYYDVRNRLIVNSIYENKSVNTKRRIVSFLCKEFIKDILRYDYTSFDLTVQGVIDFCRGIDWLEQTDAEKRHMKLVHDVSRLNPAIAVKMEKAVKKSDVITAQKRVEQVKIVKNQKWDYVKAIMNWIIPLRSSKIIGQHDFMNIRNFIGYKEIIVIDQGVGKGYLYQKNYKMLFQFIGTLCGTIYFVFINYLKGVKGYQSRIKETGSVKFWERYLNIAGSSGDKC